MGRPAMPPNLPAGAYPGPGPQAAFAGNRNGAVFAPPPDKVRESHFISHALIFVVVLGWRSRIFASVKTRQAQPDARAALVSLVLLPVFSNLSESLFCPNWSFSPALFGVAMHLVFVALRASVSDTYLAAAFSWCRKVRLQASAAFISLPLVREWSLYAVLYSIIDLIRRNSPHAANGTRTNGQSPHGDVSNASRWSTTTSWTTPRHGVPPVPRISAVSDAGRSTSWCSTTARFACVRQLRLHVWNTPTNPTESNVCDCGPSDTNGRQFRTRRSASWLRCVSL